MDQDKSQYCDFARLTNRYPTEIQHQASREMGFLKPLVAETSESSKAKAPEEEIVLSDTEDENNHENSAVEKPLPLISVKQEPVDDLHENPSVLDKSLSLLADINHMTTVIYGPHQLQPLLLYFQNLICSLSWMNTEDPADEEDNLPLSQVKKNKEKAKGKKKVQEEQADTNPVQKIQVFTVPAPRRKTRSSSIIEQKETPSLVRKSKRKQTAAEPNVSQEATRHKKRKKSISTNPDHTLVAESQPDVSAVVPLETITPQFLSDEFAARWDSTNQRKILSERFLDVEKFKSQCQLMPVFEKLNLVKSVTSLKSYPPVAIKEFYANLMLTLKEVGSSQYGRVWLRGNEYNFNPSIINMYLGIDASDIEDPVLGANTITKVITGGTYNYCPTETNMLPAKSLTTKYAILHKIAMTNWMPSEHRGGLNLHMANLIYRIGKCILVDLGDLIFKHVATFKKPATKESKVKLPFPCTIYGVLYTQGFKPEPNEPVDVPQVRLIDARLKSGSHVLDIFPEHGSSSAPALNLDAPYTSRLTAQHLDRSIKDLNTIIQILVEKRTIEMQLREQLRLRDQEMAATTAGQSDEPSMTPDAQTTSNLPDVEVTLNSQEAESSESE
ncbi:uncharacterized protein LOC116005806 [Ipomoea triloba]|uniref:uncharacterized protein LOC116005806 n=1 Tax=Ipomoea triloba TaxID=35885 RepID=UPI00125DB82A|nr:uncharacterized protein LOC116005806 [Ipomoea triloba]